MDKVIMLAAQTWAWAAFMGLINSWSTGLLFLLFI